MYEDDYNLETLSVNTENLKYDMTQPLNVAQTLFKHQVASPDISHYPAIYSPKKAMQVTDQGFVKRLKKNLP
jgi:hypothetical protein